MLHTNLHPIGTIVNIGTEDLYMIISRYPLTIQNGVKGYFEYSACVYPLGVDMETNEMFFFNHDNIIDVVFEGYINEAEKRVQEYYKDNIKNVTYPKLNVNME